MKMLKKLLANSMLLGILFGLLILPIGSIGLTGLKNTNVLSEQDVWEDLPRVQTPSIYDNHYINNPQIQESLETTASQDTTPMEVDYTQNSVTDL